MSIRVLLLLAVCLLLNNQSCRAEEFTLEQALAIAIENNLDYKAAQSSRAIAGAEIKSAGARINPHIVSDSGFAEDTYRLGIEQTFELGGKRHKRIDLAQEQQLLTDIDQAVLNLRSNVRNSYVNLHIAQEQLVAYQDILTNSQKLLTVANKKQKAGDSSKLDVLQVDITVINANNDLQMAATKAVTARNQLNSLLSQELAREMKILKPSVPTMLVDKTSLDKDTLISSLIDFAFERRPELQRNIKSIEVARSQERLEKSKRMPDLSLTFGPDLVTSDDTQFNAFFIANMGLPVWDRQQGPILKAKAEQTYLDWQQQALEKKTALEITNAVTEFFANSDRVIRYDAELLPKALEVVEKSRRSFEEGKASILVPMSAQQAYANTKLGYLQAMADLQGTISKLEQAVGASL
jgi:cobalt-zinc-cadmium efflux system outer membrane protein